MLGRYPHAEALQGSTCILEAGWTHHHHHGLAVEAEEPVLVAKAFAHQVGQKNQHLVAVEVARICRLPA